MDDLNKYKGNSRSGQGEPNPRPRPKIEQVVSVPPQVRKRGAWSRVRSILFEDDARSIGAGVFEDVIVPKIKDMLFDVLTDGAHRSLYGGAGTRQYNRVDTRRNYASYHRPGVQQDREPRREERPALERRDRSLHDFSAITFRNAGEAEGVADRLVDHIQEFGLATVNDFYDSIGLTGEFTDDNYGWFDLTKIRVKRNRDGYILDLPRPEQIDK